MKKGLSKSEFSSLQKIAKKYDLDLMVLFGSRAKGGHNKNSDYDIAFWKILSVDDEIRLFDEIMGILQCENIDLININKNHDVKLRYEIFFNGCVIYEKEKGLFQDLKGRAWIDYMDFKRFSSNRLDLLKKDLEEFEV
jgi:predicted nucleotidyltransferase